MGKPRYFFLEVASGQRYCIYHASTAGETRGSVLFVHAFAEEMNKSRRMAALQSRALADAGFEVLQIDLLGCGDSSGDFGDADWTTWIDDAEAGARWLLARHGAPLWLWGHRVGCLVATAVAPRIGSPCNLLLWQPPTSGKLPLQQFLRLKAAADMIDGGAKGVIAALRQQLRAGEAVEIAGYRLSAPLAAGLEAATLDPPAPAASVAFIEVASSEPPEPTLAVAAAAERWRDAGWRTSVRAVGGPAFWQTVEIEDASALIPATVAAALEAAA